MLINGNGRRDKTIRSEKHTERINDMFVWTQRENHKSEAFLVRVC